MKRMSTYFWYGSLIQPHYQLVSRGHISYERKQLEVEAEKKKRLELTQGENCMSSSMSSRTRKSSILLANGLFSTFNSMRAHFI